MGKKFQKKFTQLRENLFGSQKTFKNLYLFGGKLLYSYIYISTLLFNYTQIKMVHLSLDSTKYELIRRCLLEPRSGLTVLKWGKSLGFWWTPGELNLSEGRAYKLSIVPARGGCNIVDGT